MTKIASILYSLIGVLCWLIISLELWFKIAPTDKLLAISAVLAGLNFCLDFSKDLLAKLEKDL